MFSNARQTLAYLPNIVMLQGRLIQGILIDDRLTFKLKFLKRVFHLEINPAFSMLTGKYLVEDTFPSLDYGDL